MQYGRHFGLGQCKQSTDLSTTSVDKETPFLDPFVAAAMHPAELCTDVLRLRA
jgi:hypothetical protein